MDWRVKWDNIEITWYRQRCVSRPRDLIKVSEYRIAGNLGEVWQFSKDRQFKNSPIELNAHTYGGKNSPIPMESHFAKVYAHQSLYQLYGILLVLAKGRAVAFKWGRREWGKAPNSMYLYSWKFTRKHTFHPKRYTTLSITKIFSVQYYNYSAV